MGTSSINHWSKFNDFVAAARRSTWRVTSRDAAIAAGEHQGVMHYVYDVVDPGSGPAFVSDLARERKRFNGDSYSEAEQNARLAVMAVGWLPGLVEENRQARGLLEEVVGQLPDALAAQVKAFLEQPGVEATFDRPEGAEDTLPSF